MTWKTSMAVGWLAGVLALAGCAGTVGDSGVDSQLLEGADETASVQSNLTGSVPIGSTLQTTANLNMRTGPSTSYTVRLVIPKGATVTTVNTTTPSGAWYNIKYNGVEGWSHGSYLTLVSTPPGGTADPVRLAIIDKAESGVGFSYWWGHGSWVPGGLSSNTQGTCTGDCPSCTHTGSYGADCSGYAAKVWSVPSWNADPTQDSHPYSTWSFNGSNSRWKTVSRSDALMGDALVYNNGSAGHIFIYGGGDAWGDMWAYEAKGCIYGIVHDLRSAASDYKVIRLSTL